MAIIHDPAALKRQNSAGNPLAIMPGGSVVSVQQSSDLVSWVPAATSDEVLSQDSQTESRRSTVAAQPDISKLFLRLRVENAWKVALSWTPSLSSDVVGYCFYYGVTSGNYTYSVDVGNRLRVVASVPLDTKLCYFVVTAYTAIGLQSQPTPEVKVKAKAKTKGKVKDGSR
jgi:hypothetical protein